MSLVVGARVRKEDAKGCFGLEERTRTGYGQDVFECTPHKENNVLL